MQRRHCLSWIAATAALCAATPTWAQPDWPSKPIRFVLSQPAGSGPDAVARLIGNELGPRLGQPIIVDNKPGGQNAIGAQAAARAPADGYTFYFTTAAALVTNPFLFKSLPYDPRKDFTSVGMVGVVPFAVSVHPGSPFHTLADLVAYAKANPGKLAVANEGPRTFGGLVTLFLAKQTGIEVNAIPYTSVGAGISDAVGGQLGVLVSDVPAVMPMVKAGRLRVLAVTSAERVAGLEAIPTVKEATVPDFDFSGWMGLVAPSGTPAAIVARVNRELDAVLSLSLIHI